MRKMKKKLLSVAIGLVAALSMISVQAFAAGKIDTNRDCELAIQYQYGETVLKNAEFEVYKVADVSAYAEYTLTDDFKQYPVEIGSYSGEAWDELASTLEGYVYSDRRKEDGPKLFTSGKTDKEGKLVFLQGEEFLKPGLYLLLGSKHETGGYVYSCEATIVSLPGADHVNNDWDYDVTIYPKSSRKVRDDGDGTVQRKVIKSWNDNGFEDVRPASINVTLLKDGEEYDSATLSAGNNWSYTWKGLDRDANWKVTEDVPDGYTVSISRNGNTFVVKNTKMPTEVITDPEPPTEPVDPRGVLGKYDENDPFGVLGAFDQGLLPQTGTTWWLAVVLAGAGMLLLALGVVLRRKA